MPIVAGVVILVMAFFGGGLISNKGDISKTIQQIPYVFNYTVGKNIPTPSPTVTPYPTDEPTQYPTVKVIYPTVDPDPVITCNIHSDCGGGTMQLRRSVCNNSTCCQIGDKWYFYQDKGKCTADQNSYASGQRQNVPQVLPNYQSPTSAPWPTYATYPTIAPYVPISKSEADALCKKQVDATTGSDCQKGQDYSVCMSGYGYNVAFPYCFN